ncbi:aldehyde ferredoxin oxidoreductase [Halorubrum californiense DSM 19288]|uniref:Aldehyde ferredoxin oxidoreductase n=1 Tax=Halorubrum californiense DSM 19288 TaxID=1227465 RepID=M0EFD5_9EURY|nr:MULTISPECIES: aldehyde ferredoxin oxidoreductase C-terminal domain-containing protein [Halorubrum]ELZ46465.1 aldehyde ferredoxin oxidoreductase [Halorubrum californiense DSM 19288]TKX70522.1 aldehyde ferredoxin oxidoreductase [Halorubrum sp. GN11GM_10-3_MGM]
MRHAQGPLLTIDLTERTASTTPIGDRLASFVGGRGLNTSLAYDRIPFDADPLGPENRLYLSTGPMQYSTTSYTGRMSATGLSPLTNGLLSSNAGGFLSRNFTGAGYAAVELVGASDDLLAVHVREIGPDGEPDVTFEEVPDLSETEVSVVSDRFAETHDLGPEHVACVGPAGENEVRFASVMTSDTRAFGRGGLGAVLGSKGVKALTFDGDSSADLDLDWPDEAGEVHREAATSDSIMKRQGTTSVTELANEVDALPSHYFAETSFEGVEGISGDRVEEKKYKKGTCSSCAFACKLPTRDEATGVETEGPEFETVMAFGSNAGVDDIVDVMAANELCDELGMDTISCGDVVSMFLESEDEFGNADLVRSLVEQIAYREGVGDKLAEGVHRASGEFGAEDWTVKGMEFSGHDGRALNGQGLAFATANRGADHMYGEFYPYEYPLVDPDDALDPEGLEGKPPKLVAKENRNAVLDSAVVCKFSRGVVTDDRLAALLDADYEDLQSLGARVVELERAFNNARGFDRRDDTLPYADAIEGFDAALSEYYALRGWNDDGTVPGHGDGIDPASAAPADD